MPESIHGGGVELPAYGDNHRQYQEILHLDKEGENRFRYFYQMVRIHRKDHACHGSCHNTRQQGSDTVLGASKRSMDSITMSEEASGAAKAAASPAPAPAASNCFCSPFRI